MKNLIYKNGTVTRIKSVLTRKRVLFALALGLGFLLITPVITYAHYARDIADRERLMNRNSTGIILRDKTGEIFYQYGKINGNDDIKLSGISDNLERALIASEDREFFKHEGYSIRGIVRAVYANALNQDPSRYGGSTITQQLVKNKLLSSDKNYLRKYQEVSMAVAVERRYTKAEILEMYLNSVYFGEGAFGIADAAKTYFNKSPGDLTVAESSMLIGVMPAPSVYSPVSGNKEKAQKQQELVLTKMVEAGYLDNGGKETAKKQPLVFANKDDAKYKHAQHYTMMVLEQLKTKYGEEKVTRYGFDVTTTLDMGWQKHAEQKIKDKVAVMAAAGGRNASLVAVDPKTGELRALVGSSNWDDKTFGKVNMATMARQPGSSFKPIFYTEAMDKGIINPATILRDEAKTYGGNYAPTNYDFKYRGDIAVRNALSQSLNIPSVDVMQKLGPREASSAAQRMGISTVTEPDKYGLSLGLGTAEVKLLELANAYAAFANKGDQFESSMVVSIKDKYGEVVKTERRKSKSVISPEASFLISSILSDNAARAPTFGGNLNIANKQVAVKTGTTNDSKDAWTMGYTPNVAVGVWVGNNENEPMRGLIGSSSAGAIWRDTISSYTKSLPDEKFEPTPKIAKMAVCKGLGKRAMQGTHNTYDEFFIKGMEPKEECNQQKPKEEKKEEKKEDEPEKKPEKPAEPEKKPENENSGSERGGRGGGEPIGGGTGPTPPPAEEPPKEPPKPPPEPEPTPPPPSSP